MFRTPNSYIEMQPINFNDGIMCKKTAQNTLMMVIVAFVILYVYTQNNVVQTHTRGVSGMVSRVAAMISKCPSTLKAKDVFENIDVDTIGLANDKKTASQVTKNFIDKNPSTGCVIMVFATWCPHCHAMMPALSQATKQSNAPTLMVDSDALSSEDLSGGLTGIEISALPTVIYVKDGASQTFRGADAPNQAAAIHTKTDASVPATRARVIEYPEEAKFPGW
jgi:thiol-disulfide isomerase/thioredoxin